MTFRDLFVISGKLHQLFYNFQLNEEFSLKG